MSSGQTKPIHPPLQALTGLRFFAAMHVVVYHNLWLLGDHAPSWLKYIASTGYCAVGLFFVLSGFILSYNYADYPFEGIGNTKRYHLSRFARIYPVYLLSFVLDAPRVIQYFLDQYPMAQALTKSVISGTAYLSLTQAWIPRLASAWNAPGWSLSNEVLFYLLLPLLIGRLGRLSWKQGWVCFWLVFIFTVSLNLALEVVLRTSGSYWLPQFLKFLPLLHLPEFVCGVLLCRIILQPKVQQYLNEHHLQSLLFSVVSVVLYLAVPRMLSKTLELVVHNGLLIPCFALMVASLTSNANYLGKFLSQRTIVYLGGASYAIYLLHQPLLKYFVDVTDWFSGQRGFGVFTAYVVVVIAVSLAVFRWYEEPLRKAIVGRFSTKREEAQKTSDQTKTGWNNAAATRENFS